MQKDNTGSKSSGNESLPDKNYSKPTFFTLMIAALIGLYASSALVYDKIAFWEAKAAGDSPVLGCDINPIVGCGNVLNTPQASIVGSLPNPLLGVIAFAAFFVVTTLLAFRVQMPKWVWIGMQVGVTVGIGVVSYLQYESIFVIGALCPWCMVVWFVTIVSFWLVSGQNILRNGPIRLKVVPDWVFLFMFFHIAAVISIIFLKFGSTLWA